MTRIKIDTDRVIGEIDRNIFGSFVEHLGRCVYGGVYDPESSFADEDGMRTDVIDAIKRLGITNIRYPGGNFVSAYHWTDGIGPKSKRPQKFDPAWKTAESNQFGTDEFMLLCGKLEAQPFICVNMGTGTQDEAQNWVEYCNSTLDTYYTNLRRSNGHNEPHNIAYWGLGNEIDGEWQVGHKSAADYAKCAKEFAKVMKQADPSIKLIACGSCLNNQEWNKIVLSELLKTNDLTGAPSLIDYISIHCYVQERDYYRYMAQVKEIEDRIIRTNAVIDALLPLDRKVSRPYLAIDEWNAINPDAKDWVMTTTLEDALVFTMFLNSFIRHSGTVKIANLAQIVNIAAPIMTKKDDMFLQTIYHPFEMFTRNTGKVSLDLFVECETFTVDHYKDVPYIDASASYDADRGTVFLCLINRHKTDEIAVNIQNQTGTIAKDFVAHELYADDLKAVNSFEKKDAVKPVTKQCDDASNDFTYTIPPHSITGLLMNSMQQKL